MEKSPAEKSPGEELLDRYRLAARIGCEAESGRALVELADRLPNEHPEEAVKACTMLAESTDDQERRTAAIIIDRLLAADRVVTLDLWRRLLKDRALEVRVEAGETLDEAMDDELLSLEEAARLRDAQFDLDIHS